MHAVILLVVVLLLFGANRLPGVARSVGQSLKIFKKEMQDLTGDGTSTSAPATPGPAATTGTTTPPAAGVPDPVASTAPEGTEVPPPPPAPPAAPRS
jgi:sec-independent protein translocase protein TatA